MLDKINEFLRTRKAQFGTFENFKDTGLYEHYGNLFGPLIYTEDTSLNFIGVDANGYFYDEFYYPYEGIKKVGTVIPEHLYNLPNPIKSIPDIIWKDVAEKGYADLGIVDVPKELVDQVMNESYIPYGFNKDLNMSKSIFHPYFATLADYKNPEQHKSPQYLKDITQCLVQKLPAPQTLIANYELTTADLIKYLYRADDMECKKGPYMFHMDWFPRAMCMIFIYFAKDPVVNGRELLVGKRIDFKNFGKEALDYSPNTQPTLENASPFEKLEDEYVPNYDIIPVGHCKMLILNTVNPMFLHKVEKLRSENEIMFISSYLWSAKRIPKD